MSLLLHHFDHLVAMIKKLSFTSKDLVANGDPDFPFSVPFVLITGSEISNLSPPCLRLFTGLELG